MDYRLGGLKIGFDSQEGERFSLIHSIHTDSGAHPVSYIADNGGSKPMDKAAEA
jgi:hypothetical protein